VSPAAKRDAHVDREPRVLPGVHLIDDLLGDAPLVEKQCKKLDLPQVNVNP
jgi:hypothetical protein